MLLTFKLDKEKFKFHLVSFAIFAREGIKHIWAGKVFKINRYPLENVLKKTSPLKAKKNMSNNQKRQHLNKSHSYQALYRKGPYMYTKI